MIPFLWGNMTTAVSFSQPAQQVYLPCDWVSDLCKAVYEIALKILKGISDFFSPATSGTTTLAPTQVGVTVTDPKNIVAFYRGLEANNNGVTLNQILGWDDGQLEAVHNYIQWLFPLPDFSAPNPTAPVLDRATILAFRSDPLIKNQMLRSFRKMQLFKREDSLLEKNRGAASAQPKSHF